MIVVQNIPINLYLIGLFVIGQSLTVASPSSANSPTAVDVPVCAEFDDNSPSAWPIGFTYSSQVLCIESDNVLAWRFDHHVEATIRLPLKGRMISQRFFIEPKVELEDGSRLLARYGRSQSFFDYRNILQDLQDSVVSTLPRFGLLDSGLTHDQSLDLLRSIGWAREVEDHKKIEVWLEDHRKDGLTGLVFCGQSLGRGTDRTNTCTYVLFSESLMIFVRLSSARTLDTEENRRALRRFVSSHIKKEPSGTPRKRLEQQEITVTFSGRKLLVPVKYLVKYLRYANRGRGFQAIVLKGEVLHARQEVEPVRRNSGRSDDVDQRSVSVVFALNEEFNAVVNNRSVPGTGENESCRKSEEPGLSESSHCRINFVLVPGIRVEFFYDTTVVTDFNHVETTVHSFLENLILSEP